MNIDTDNLNQIGDRIRRLREKNGLSQSELAKELNVKQQTIDKWEKGERDLKTGYTIALSKYFNVTADYILGLEPCTTHEAADIEAITGLSDDIINLLSKDVKMWSKEEIYNFNIFLQEILNDNIILSLGDSKKDFETIYEMHEIDCTDNVSNQYARIACYMFCVREYDRLVYRMKKILDKFVNYLPDRMEKIEKEYNLQNFDLLMKSAEFFCER